MGVCQEILRHPIIHDANVLFRRGNDLHFTNGIVVQNLANKMVKILDISDDTIHHCHVEQIHYISDVKNIIQTLS